MKKVIFLILMAFSINLSANAVKDVVDSVTTVVKDVSNVVDTSKISKQLYTDIKAGIAGLATGLKVSAEKVWDILVKQQLVYSISKLLIGIVLIIVSQFLIRRGWKLWQKAKPNNSRDEVNFDDGIWCPMIIIGAIITITNIIFFIINFSTIVTGLINPEYGAIQDIVSFVNN